MPDFKRLGRIFSPRATSTDPALETLAQPPPTPSVTQTSFHSSYAFLKNLKEGDCGWVALYTHQQSFQSIIVKPVKTVHPKIPIEYVILNRCKNAANIVTVLGLCPGVPDPRTDAILLEYCRYGDLLEYQNLFVDNRVYPSERTMKAVFRQLLQALVFLHDGVGSGTDTKKWKPIVHRDIKLENVLISKMDEEGGTKEIFEIKLADFDLALSYNKKHSKMEDGKGSPVTWPPEQTLQKCKAKPAGDVWAVGAVIHALAHSTYPLRDVVEYKAEYLRNNERRYPKEIGQEDRDTLRERWYWEALAPRQVTPLTAALDGYDGSGARVDRHQPDWLEQVEQTRSVYSQEFSDLVGSALKEKAERKTALQLLGEMSNMLNW